MIHRLPHWVLTDKNPAFYDSESLTAVKMTARLYAKMQELVDDYNKFVDIINDEIELFTSSSNAEIEDFKFGIRQEFQDFIDLVELKLNEQDDEILQAVNFMKQNLSNSITNLILEMKANGEFNEAIETALADLVRVQLNYLPEEQLYITNPIQEVVIYNEPEEQINILGASNNPSPDIDISGVEKTSNKVTEISSESTDDEYPTAQAVFEYVNDKVSTEIDEALGGEY